MKKLFIFLFAISTLTTYGQECDCPSQAPEGGEVMKTFSFGEGKGLGICGYSTVEAGDTTYTKFVLFRCGEDAIIEQWGVNISCKVEQTKDALLVKEMYNLPIGTEFSTLWRPLYVHQYTFTGNETKHTTYYDKKAAKYTPAQIAAAIKQYKELPETVTEHHMETANMLFWSARSGSKEAEGYLKTFPDKFGPFASPFNEEWDAVNMRYEQWKNISK